MIEKLIKGWVTISGRHIPIYEGPVVKRAINAIRSKRNKSAAAKMSKEKRLLVKLETKRDELEHKKYLQKRENDKELYPVSEDDIRKAEYDVKNQKELIAKNEKARQEKTIARKQKQAELKEIYKDYSDKDIQDRINYLESLKDKRVRPDAYKTLPKQDSQELKNLKMEQTRRKNSKPKK